MSAARTGVTPDVLAGLLRKYRVLARWRRAKDRERDQAGDPADVASPPAMRALAEEFPGALRELDLLGLAELERRVACLEAAAGDGQGERAGPGEIPHEDRGGGATDGEPWIGWIAAYHTLMRVALALRSPSPPAAAPPPIADETFLRDVQRPPGGRLSAAVLEALARLFQRPVHEFRTVLFPPRR